MIGAPRIEPSDAASEALEMELVAFKIEAIQIGNLELPTFGWFECRGELTRAFIVKIKARDGIIASGSRGFLFEPDHAPVGAELGNAIGGRIADVIPKNARSARSSACALEKRVQRISVEDIVSENQRGGMPLEEGLGNEERFGEPAWVSLLCVAELHAPLLSASEESPKKHLLMRRRDDQDLANSRLEQRRKGIVDHRFIVDREQLLAHSAGERMKPCASPSCEYDPATAHAASPPLFV